MKMTWRAWPIVLVVLPVAAFAVELPWPTVEYKAEFQSHVEIPVVEGQAAGDTKGSIHATPSVRRADGLVPSAGVFVLFDDRTGTTTVVDPATKSYTRSTRPQLKHALYLSGGMEEPGDAVWVGPETVGGVETRKYRILKSSMGIDVETLVWLTADHIPVRTERRMMSKLLGTFQLTKVERGPVDPALLQIPADYTRKGAPLDDPSLHDAPVAKLIQMLGSESEAERSRALGTLEGRGRSVVPELLQAASHDPSALVRQNALSLVDVQGADVSMVDPLIAIVEKDKEKKVVDAAVKILAELGPEAKKAAPALEALLQPYGGEQLFMAQPKNLDPHVAGILAALRLVAPEKGARVQKLVTMRAATMGGAPAPMVVGGLTDPDPEVQKAALVGLGSGGYCGSIRNSTDLADKAWPAVLEGLDSDDARVRAASAVLIDCFGTRGLATRPRLRELLHDSDPEVKVNAELTLENMDRTAEGAAALAAEPTPAPSDHDKEILAQIESLATAPANERSAISQRIDFENMDQAEKRLFWPAIAKLLDSPDQSVRHHALEILQSTLPDRVPPPAPELPLQMLRRELHDSYGYSQVKACEILRRFPDSADSLIPELVAALRDPFRELRLAAARTLERMPKGLPLAIPVLVEGLAPDSGRMDTASESLIAYKAKAGSAVPAVIRRLDDPDEGARERAVRVLGGIGWPAGSATPALVARMKDPSLNVRRKAVIALGDIGPAAAAAVPALGKEITDPHSKVRPEAISALGKIGPEVPGVLDILKRTLASSEPGTRRAAADALFTIGRAALPAKAALEKATSDSDEWVRSASAHALKEIAPPPPKPLDPRMAAAYAAAGAQRMVNVDYKALQRGLESPKPATRAESVRQIGRIAPQPMEIQYMLKDDIFQDEDPAVRKAAIEAFKLPPGGSLREEVVAIFRRFAAEDPSSEVREAASKALERAHAGPSGGEATLLK